LDGGSAHRMATTTQDTTKQKNTDTLHASSGIRTHDPIVPVVEDRTCFRQRGQWNRQPYKRPGKIIVLYILILSFYTGSWKIKKSGITFPSSLED